ncbi:hypothetical protein [Thermococcus barophilus]|uniref:Transcription regulator AsnC/Lrp ligand binding domain-containing protein n=1 Tax=Thermococcus barophilus (strain DSM 11836 / MP) TaxID=391623 RepID=F0LIE7_THEBM|nr:hypothetical protein [Thermococcus barophilus]ADT84477.1 hypothetical protein TERMP_01502 [Thermococcus barophilus MP]
MKSILLIRGFRGCEKFIDYYLKIHSFPKEIFLVEGEYNIIAEIEYEDYESFKKLVSELCKLHEVSKITILNVKNLS